MITISTKGAVAALSKYLNESQLKGGEAIAFLSLMKWVRDLEDVFIKNETLKAEVANLKDQLEKIKEPKAVKKKISKKVK